MALAHQPLAAVRQRRRNEQWQAWLELREPALLVFQQNGSGVTARLTHGHVIAQRKREAGR